MWGVAFAVLALCLITSTRKGRAEMRDRIKPFGRIAGVLTLAFWAAFAWAAWMK